MIVDQYGDPIKIEKKSLTSELANWTTATGSDHDILPDPDPVLRKKGDDAQVLKALAADDQVTMVMQLRKRKITNKKNYDYTPGQPEKGKSATDGATTLCRDLTFDLADIKLKSIFSSSLDAPFWGYTVFELYWAVDSHRLRLIFIQEKPREWFCFDGTGNLCFLENGQKKPVPYGKFLVVQHEPTFENSYGLRLLSRCLWPVAFKRAGTEWCMRFLERYGQAWQVAKAPVNWDSAKRAKLASSLAAMVQDAVAVLPHGSEHQIVKVDSKSGGAAFLEFLHFWNAAISKVLSCQTQSSETSGTVGTYASSKTHYTVLGDVAEADEQLVCDAMNDLAVIYARVNESQEYPPVFSYVEAEDHLAQADLDKKRHAVGVRFTKAYFERQGLAPDEFYLAEPKNGLNSSKQPPFAIDDPADHAKKPRNENLAFLDRISERLGRQNQGVVDDIFKSVKKIMAKAGSLNELKANLASAFPKVEDGDLGELIAQAIAAGELAGRVEVETDE